ncbi:hypothetical protein BDN70DRAFT_874888 [Pholiota conissans]|uniref:Uncharacterized protein n=1 Tax=Pholiota conissans TaxID=109636 RepID=A0A9P5Z981_9AGAR|nr:hypothetical protein BDN70DRAFT_874888 [Pholiota conissans]
MGLLKRLFSMGSKKNKKERPPIIHNVPVPELPWAGLPTASSSNLPNNDEEHEAAVGRLLRSSSARFTESSDLNYATLPPLPHPINHVIQTPGSSAVSLASTTISQRGTYNVTVHKRRRHTSTEIPPVPTNNGSPSKKSNTNAKRSSLLAEDSRVLRLRSDPSVASLLELYDEHGKVAANAFSNDSPARNAEPPKDGRAQVRRNGSTLRQLLGVSTGMCSRDENESGSAEGDISWAERFLAETDAASSTSSIAIKTPTTPHYYTQPLKPEASFITDGDISISTIDNPAISSMEVEVSTISDISMQVHEFSKVDHTGPYMNTNPSTPQRASQVFEFLTRKRSTTAANLDRTLPELPSCFSSPSDDHGSNLNFHFNDPPPFTFAPTRMSAMPTSFHDNTPRPSRTRPQSSVLEHSPSILDKRESQYLRSAFSDDSHETHYASGIHVHQDPQDTIQNTNTQETKANDIKVIMNGPTKVIVTAPTPSAHGDLPSRLPRGPRALPKKSSSGSVKRRRSALVEVSNSSSSASVSDPFAAPAPRRRPQTNRRSSQTSVNSQTRGSYDECYPSRIRQPEVVSPSMGQHKENQLGLSVKSELPSTPLRSNTTGSRSLLRTVVQQAMFHPPLSTTTTPSPASSSEMSPVGRQIMMDVRQQRMHAREVERERVSKRARSDRAQRV